MANDPFNLLSSAPTLPGAQTQIPSTTGIPWEQFFASQRTPTPQENFGAILQFLQNYIGGAHRGASGFIQAPTESQQLAEDAAVWNAKFPRDRQAQAIAKEQAAFGDRLPSFTQQEMANRSMTPQERINQRMGPGWATMDPTQRRIVLQRLAGQTPDMVNPTTGQSSIPPVISRTGFGPSMINGMPAQQAIAQATRGANQAQAASDATRRKQTKPTAKRQPLLGMF